MDDGVDRVGDASELDDVGVAGGVPADGVGHTDGAFLVDLAESVDLAEVLLEVVVPDDDVVLGGHVDDDVVPDDDVVLDEHVDDGVAAEVLLEVVVPVDVVLGGHVDDDVVKFLVEDDVEEDVVAVGYVNVGCPGEVQVGLG